MEQMTGRTAAMATVTAVLETLSIFYICFVVETERIFFLWAMIGNVIKS